MNAVVTTNVLGAPPAFREPAASQALQHALYVAHFYPRDLAVIPAVRDEARAALRHLNVAASPIGERAALRWLASLNMLVGNSLSTADLDKKGRALAGAIAGHPGCAFTDSAMRDLAAEHFPGLAKIEEALKPVKERVDRSRRLLTAVLEAPDSAPMPAGPYVIPPPPPWAGSRDMRAPSGPTSPGDPRHSLAQPPVRTVEQQLAFLRGGEAA